jgi:transposase InsO family protein
MTTETVPGTPARVYFRPTTVGQRQLLFRLAQESGNVSEAARQAHVSRSTYYYWQPRYEADPVGGVAAAGSRAPHRTRIPPISAELQAEVLAYHQAHPGEGCRSIANAICKAHDWQKVIGHSKVHELVVAARESVPASSAPAPAAVPVEGQPTEAVHAPQAGQTANLDLCVVPWTHDGTQALAPMSLSEAAAGFQPTDGSASAPKADWPGQVFEAPALSYPEQMRVYAEKRAVKRAAKGQRKHRRRQKQAERTALNARSDDLRVQRRQQRQARRREDALWKAQRQAHQTADQAGRTRSKPERRQHRAEHPAEQVQWRTDRAARRAQLQQRQVEDAQWRQARQEIRAKLAELTASAPLVTVWLAVLVIVDNGTRQCLGLPFFTAGAHVTADMIVAALRAIWPPELDFVITDNGAQFIAEAFARFAQDMDFLHVRIAPHRPRTNGIAERFVRTLKEWLETHTWHSPEEFAALLAEFIEYYNNRPHQGAELDGLSPNEFARRLAQCSTC